MSRCRPCSWTRAAAERRQPGPRSCESETLSRAQELVDGVSDLSVLVGAGSLPRRVDIGALERRQREYRPAPHRRLVGHRREDRGEAGVVADRSERRYRCLSHERVVVEAGQVSKASDGAGFGTGSLSARPGGGLDDGRMRIVEKVDDRWVDPVSGDLECRDPYRMIAVAECHRQLVVAESLQSSERSNGGDPDDRRGVVERGRGCVEIAGMSGHSGGASSISCGGAAHARMLVACPPSSVRITDRGRTAQERIPRDRSRNKNPEIEGVGVSHIVIHDGADAVTQYEQFDDMAAAIAYVEELRNRDGVESARLFELQEVAFEMKAYFKVELDGQAPAAEVIGSAEVVATAPDPEMVFETTSEPIEAVATKTSSSSDGDEDADEDADPSDEPRLTSTGGEARRGLFGR